MTRRRYKPRRRKNNDDNSIRLLVLSFLILLAVIFKVATGVSTITVFKEFSSAAMGKQTYQDAISTLGAAISEGAAERAIVVFGKNIIGAKTNEETSDNTLPIVNESDKETEEKDEGRVTTVPAFAEDVNISMIDFIENSEEYIDDTPNEPFEFPLPDNVDNHEYELPFEYIRPCEGTITSPFGYREHPISGKTTFHYGIDIAFTENSPIVTMSDGTVIECGNSAIFGNYVKIQHDDGFVSFYGHLNSVKVKKGDNVNMGDEVGLMGQTGVATGPHLHFEIRRNNKRLNPSYCIDE